MCWQCLMNSRYLILWNHSAGVFGWGPAVAWHERQPEETIHPQIDDRHVMTLINTTTQSNRNIVDATRFFLLLAASCNLEQAEGSMFPETHPSVPTQNNICSTDSIGAGSIQLISAVEKMQYGIMGPTEPGALMFPRQVWRCLPRAKCHLSPRKRRHFPLSGPVSGNDR